MFTTMVNIKYVTILSPPQYMKEDIRVKIMLYYGNDGLLYNLKEGIIMRELIERMSQGKESYDYPTPDGRVITVKGDTEREAKEKFYEYMGWD